MEKSVMICGAGFGQIPAIIAAKQLGLQTIVLDKNPVAQGMLLADFAYPVDIVDIPAAIDIAKKHRISGVLTMQSDVSVPTVGAVNDALGLSGISFTTAQCCCNKIETRIRLREAGIPQPLFYIVKDKEEAIEACQSIGFPCIIKAPDSSGSRGVVKVNNEVTISEAIIEAKKYTTSKSLLVEEYIVGEEIGAQTFSFNGSCKVVLVHNDIMSSPPFMIPIGHSFPSSLSLEKLQLVERTTRKCVEALGIYSGPANVDIIIDKDSNPRFIEVGARIGATCLPELVFYHTGIDWVKSAVLAAIGEEPDLTKKIFQSCAAYILESPADGILKKVVIPEICTKNTDVLECEVTVEVGSEIRLLRKGTDRIGKIIVKGPDLESSMKLAEALRESIQFDVEPINT